MGVRTSSVSAEGAATEGLTGPISLETAHCAVSRALDVPIGEGSGETEETTPGCGPDWCEIPELAEKPKRKKRTKDVVRE